MAMDDTRQFDLALAELRHAAQREQRVTAVRYSPWLLSFGVSAAIGALVGPVVVLVLAGSPWWANVLVGVVLAPIPLAVCQWSWRAYGVELFRLRHEGTAFAPARQPEPEPDKPADVELRPGYPVDGEMMAPAVDVAPEVAELRAACLRFVRAGLRRNCQWSRSKIAEGPNKLMSGEDWDRASKELQRLAYFSGSPLKPSREVGDIIKRLELAR